MAKLVIVESPAKAKTIGKYLGRNYKVTASMGHVRDLPASQLGIDVENGYTPKYITIKGKQKLVKELTYFCRFQRLIGVETQWELVYHMCSFLASVVKMPDGIFDPTPENISILNKVAERILITDCPEETLERLKDDRGFCIDPERLRTIDESTKRTMTNKAVRIANYLEIRKKYDDSKSKAQNAAICGVSDATIARFRRNRTELERICSSCFGIK